jgi:hypothetical protein
MTTTTEVSDSLERVESIINMLDEICDHMDDFSSAEGGHARPCRVA